MRRELSSLEIVAKFKEELRLLKLLAVDSSVPKAREIGFKFPTVVVDDETLFAVVVETDEEGRIIFPVSEFRRTIPALVVVRRVDDGEDFEFDVAFLFVGGEDADFREGDESGEDLIDFEGRGAAARGPTTFSTSSEDNFLPIDKGSEDIYFF